MPIYQRFFLEQKLAVTSWIGSVGAAEAISAPRELMTLISGVEGVALAVDQLKLDRLDLDEEGAQTLMREHLRHDPHQIIERIVQLANEATFKNAMALRAAGSVLKVPIPTLTSIASAADALRIPEDTLTALIKLTRTGKATVSEA